MEAESTGAENLSLEVYTTWRRGTSFEEIVSGVNHLPASCGPVASGKYNCLATSAISCVRHRYDCRVRAAFNNHTM